MHLNEEELRAYLLDAIPPTSEATIEILKSVGIVYSKDCPKTDEEKRFKFCIKADYDNNIFYINNSYSLSEILTDVKRCIYNHPDWNIEYSRELSPESLANSDDQENYI